MTDRQIRCFLALYETLNFSAAARQLFLTQPTLSYQIRTLEEELGTPLFTRTTCRVEPTEAGQLFAAFAQNVRQSYQAFQHALAAGPARREKLVLQVPLTMASRDLVYHDLLMALSQELPDCDLEVRTDTSCTSPEEVLQSPDPDTAGTGERRHRLPAPVRHQMPSAGKPRQPAECLRHPDPRPAGRADHLL